jgi:copper chaperone NosL
MTRRDLLGALAAAALLAACKRAARDPAPVEIAFGRDECAYCRMTIDERHLAAEFVEPGGRAHKFGEPGCLVNWMRKGATPEGTAFVTDAAEGGWLPAAGAAYVAGRVRTPMSYNVTAYRSPPAGAAADAVRDWRTLLAEGVTGAPR